MIYLIGVNHGLQFVNKTSNLDVISEFEQYIKAACAKYGIECIAEEMSIESLKNYGATRCVCKSIADELSVSHMLCDPDSNEREERGIKLEKKVREELGYSQILNDSQVKKLDEALKTQWALREQIWLDRILEIKADRILFVLGSSHIDSFSDLLTKNGIAFLVLERKRDT